MSRRSAVLSLVLSAVLLLSGCASVGKYVQTPRVDDLHLAPITSVEEVMESQMAVEPDEGMNVVLVVIPQQWRKQEFVFKTVYKPNGDPVSLRRMVSRVLVCDRNFDCGVEPWSAVWTRNGDYAVFLPKEMIGGSHALILSGDARKVLTLRGKIVRQSVESILENPKAFFTKNASEIRDLVDARERERIRAQVILTLPLRTVKPIDGRQYRTTPLFVQTSGVSNMDLPEHRVWASGGASIGTTDILGGGLPLAFKTFRLVHSVVTDERVGAFQDVDDEGGEESETAFSGDSR